VKLTSDLLCNMTVHIQSFEVVVKILSSFLNTDSIMEGHRTDENRNTGHLHINGTWDNAGDGY